eukprot:187708-Ditylum_brightwellii.AAC.1
MQVRIILSQHKPNLWLGRNPEVLGTKHFGFWSFFGSAKSGATSSTLPQHWYYTKSRQFILSIRHG